MCLALGCPARDTLPWRRFVGNTVVARSFCTGARGCPSFQMTFVVQRDFLALRVWILTLRAPPLSQRRCPRRLCFLSIAPAMLSRVRVRSRSTSRPGSATTLRALRGTTPGTRQPLHCDREAVRRRGKAEVQEGPCEGLDQGRRRRASCGRGPDDVRGWARRHRSNRGRCGRGGGAAASEVEDDNKKCKEKAEEGEKPPE